MPQTVAEIRAEAARCRALAGGCFHRPTGDVLRQLAVELDAKADMMETGLAGAPRLEPVDGATI